MSVLRCRNLCKRVRNRMKNCMLSGLAGGRQNKVLGRPPLMNMSHYTFA